MKHFKQILVIGAAIFGIGTAFTTKEKVYSARTYGIIGVTNHLYSVVLFQPLDDCIGNVNTCSYQINDNGITFSIISTTSSLIIQATKATGVFTSSNCLNNPHPATENLNGASPIKSKAISIY